MSDDRALDRVPPHSHCVVCGKAIPEGETFCSEKCRMKYEKMRKRQSMSMWIMVGILVAVGIYLTVKGA
ncbi:MAG: DUF2116 family Zn-ribbon domain-containing protein [Methanopyri archaeon]|nr:DUF2116 family Zn-ribbon domain-containing protein [Methanopyri archaeon]